jgi:dihydropyrimidine dehydrogenase (NAD+) subunit PreA
MTKILTDAQLAAEIAKCEYCEEKPCKDACPANCSPADFLMAAKQGEDFDYIRAANEILSHNPLGGICGAVCPEQHCMSGCVYKKFNQPVNIPATQATIIHKAKQLNKMPKFTPAPKNGKTIVIIGAGPAGLAAAAVLAQQGYAITILEQTEQAGGRCNLIPDTRLAKDILQTDIEFIKTLGDIKTKYKQEIQQPEKYLLKYSAVLVSTGLNSAVLPGIPGEEHVVLWDTYLQHPKKLTTKNKQIAIIGGGAVAVDCAVTAKENGAKRVDMICLETNADMPITTLERNLLLENDIVIIPKTTVTAIESNSGTLTCKIAAVNFPKGGKFSPTMIIANSANVLNNYDAIIMAIGSYSTLQKSQHKKIFYAGDIINGATSVVEAVASGKNAAAAIDAYLNNQPQQPTTNTKSKIKLQGAITIPVSLTTDFFGRKIISPFILSAAPPSDGYEQMKLAYDAGWAGGVMKTAFDNVPIHIPAEYMFAYDKSTYANCDNVSGHSLDKVCQEIKKLVQEYPDRLTIGSTGGPVTGNDATDKQNWQANTHKLEQAGAMAIEYSLSCPQGGDGTEGDIVSQNAKLTAKIIDWIMEISDPEIPKLFKLTGAVTSIIPIIQAIKAVFNKYPNKKAGITLANTFPTLTFRKGNKNNWEEGIIAGMSGEAVKYISYLTLANAGNLGVTISGNGGPMDYKAAANFLALGANTVQFCTIVLKYGVHIIKELHSGLSYLMQAKGYKSVKELISSALPNPITDFMNLPSLKKISTVNKDLCEHCGNCSRCPYLAITLNEDKIPQTDPAKCIGCSICVQKCFAKALSMRERTAEELEQLKEE